MEFKLSIKSFIICASLLIQSVAWADSQMQQVIDNFASQPQYTYSNLGICVQELANGKVIAEHASNKAIPSASTMKTVTSATALALLGDDYRFHTLVKLLGEQQANTFYGDVIVVGAGDPTLNSAYFPVKSTFLDKIIVALEARGIKKIVGSLRVDSGNYSRYGSNLNVELEDMGTDYGTGVYALNYNDNLIGLQISSNKGRLKVKLDKELDFNVTQYVQIGKNDELAIFPYPTEKLEFFLAGEFPFNSKPRFYEVSNPKPEVALLYDLEQKLAKHNISLKKTDTVSNKAQSSILLDYESPRLAEIIKSLLSRSDNMYADAVLLELAKANKTVPNRQNGVKTVKSYWSKQGVDCQPLFMYDGSGLSRRDCVSARFLTQLLAKAEQNKGVYTIGLSKLMPSLGKDLHISYNITKAKLVKGLSAKSGGMTNVRCYTGYYPADNPIYTWSIMVNNFHASDKEVRDDIGKLLVQMFKNK